MNNKKKTPKRLLGDKGEDYVCSFLTKRGYTVIERNYLKPYGEIDIVALYEGKYYFIEVKTVSCEMNKPVSHATLGVYRPEDNVHLWKIQRLGRVIQAYLLHKKLFDADWQFDIALVYIDKATGDYKIELLEDIVL